MNGIQINVEFRQRTVAGLADCRADRSVFADYDDEDTVRDIIAYVQRIIRSEVMDVSITFSYRNGVHTVETSRIWYSYPSYSTFHVVKWERWNSRDEYEYDKIRAKQIRELYLECVARYEKEVA